VGYYQGPKKYKERLEAVLRGENTFEVLKKSYDKNPDNIEMAFELAKKYANMRDTDTQKKILKNILANHAEKAKKITVPYYQDKQVNAYEYASYILASDIFGTQNPAPLLKFIEKFPEGDLVENAYNLMSNFFMYFGNEKEADLFFARLLEKYPYNSRLLTSYVLYCERTKRQLDKAKETAEKIIRQSRTVFNDPYYNLAKVLAVSEDSTQLESKYGQKHFELRVSTFARELGSYSNFWMKRNSNMENALKAAKIAIILAPKNIYQRYSLANNYMKRDKLAEALEVFGPGVILDFIDNASDVNLYIGFWTNHKQNLDHAFEMAEMLYEENPEDGNTAQALAKLYMVKGNEAEAIKVYGKDKIKDFWGSGEHLNTYAWFWAETGGNLKHALKASLQSIKVEKNNHFYLDTAALIYYKLAVCRT